MLFRSAGRVQMAEQLLQMHLIKDPTQYFQVLNTGRLEVMFEGDVSQQLLVRKENEMLSEGDAPLVSPLDLHAFHIQEHRAVLDDTDIRNSPEIIKNVMDHIESHIDKLTNTDPRVLMLTGQQPLPPPPGPAGPGAPMPGAPGTPGSPTPGGPPMPPPNQPQGGPAPSPMMPKPNQGKIIGQGGAPQAMPHMPTVKSGLLPNPGIQEQSLGNVRNK